MPLGAAAPVRAPRRLVWQVVHFDLYQHVVREPLSHCHTAGAVPAVGQGSRRWAAGTGVLAGVRARRAGEAVVIAVLLVVAAAGVLAYDVSVLHADFVSGMLAPYACD